MREVRDIETMDGNCSEGEKEEEEENVRQGK